MERECYCAGCGQLGPCTLVRDGWYCASCIAAMGTAQLPDVSGSGDLGEDPAGSPEPSVEADFYTVTTPEN